MTNNEEKEVKKAIQKVTRTSDVFTDLIDNAHKNKYSSRLSTTYDGVNEDLKKELLQDNDANEKGTRTRLATSTGKGKVQEKGKKDVVVSKLQTKVTGSGEANATGTVKQREKHKVDRIATRVKKVNKGTREIMRTSELLEKQEDGGVDYVKNTSKYASKKAGRKIGNKVKSKTVTPVMQRGTSSIVKAIGKVFLKFKKYLPFIGGGFTTFVIPLCIVIVVLMSISAVFGGGGSNRSISTYEQHMNTYQQKYDQKVDDWKKANPDGLVFGARGSYGAIEWRAPLTIIQTLNTKLKGDTSEMYLLRMFDEAGLFEQHIEGEIEEKYMTGKKDDNGHFIYEVKVIKTLTIINPSLEDYKLWSKDNFSIIKGFLDLKKIKYKSTYSYFTKKELERMDVLYGSEDFFYMFSDKWQDYAVKIGNNETNANVDSAHYQANNPYTQNSLRGQCTWYVWGRTSEVLGIKLPYKMGNAQHWINSAQAQGYKTGTKPSKNSIMVLSGGDYGHVTYVEGWDGTTITYSEGNYNNPHANDAQMVSYANEHYKQLLNSTTISYESLRSGNTYQIHGLVIVGYIYLE